MGDILFLAHRVPYPPDRGDKIRGFHILKHLSERHRVHLVAFADTAADLRQEAGLAPYTDTRAIVRRSKSTLVAGVQAMVARKPVSLTAFEKRPVQAAVDRILVRHPVETIYVFSSQMAQYLPDPARRRVVMDFVDMDSAKFATYAEGAGGVRGAMFAREARLLAGWETQVAARADASLFVSEAEAALFRAGTGARRVHVVENGIDTNRFAPEASFERVAAPGPLIVFTGQMDYRPNVEAVTWFAEAILPRIRERHPAAAFAVVGRNPVGDVRALARTPGVIVTGEVPDVRGWLAAAAVVVAPLKLARGIQNKVLEAMAMARPVVASQPAAEGIDHAGTIRTGKTAADIADTVGVLLDDPHAAAALAAAARRRVIARYGWAARLAPLDESMGPTRQAAPGRRSAA